MKVYNFSAGPSMLYDEVKLAAQRDFIDYQGCGQSVTEMSHRSKVYEPIQTECINLFRELMNIPDDYYVLLLQGGASTQFEAIPLNLLKKGADYVVTGNFANKAYKEAIKYGDVACAASSKDANYTFIPKNVKFRDNIDYVHITMNNTIFGTRYVELPKVPEGAFLVGDLSSIILSEEVDVSKFGLIYAGAQKNIGPAGLTVVIVRKDLINEPQAICPTMLKYSTQAENDSLYNTPPCFSIYMAMLTLRHIKSLGGIKEVQKINEKKAAMLYDYIDNSGFYKNNVAVEDRSLMNVPFISPNADLDAKFVSEASKAGLVNIKGHRLVGGMRASIYNAMPVEGIETLIAFMKKFAEENK